MLRRILLAIGFSRWDVDGDFGRIVQDQKKVE